MAPLHATARLQGEGARVRRPEGRRKSSPAENTFMYMFDSSVRVLVGFRGNIDVVFYYLKLSTALKPLPTSGTERGIAQSERRGVAFRGHEIPECDTLNIR